MQVGELRLQPRDAAEHLHHPLPHLLPVDEHPSRRVERTHGAAQEAPITFDRELQRTAVRHHRERDPRGCGDPLRDHGHQDAVVGVQGGDRVLLHHPPQRADVPLQVRLDLGL